MGLLIAIEGIDGSGGTTQCKLLVEWLTSDRKYPVMLTREPSVLPIGELLRKYLKKDCHPAVDALLFAADRADHYFTVIDLALKEGKIVISDRHKLSSLAYQWAEGLDFKWIQKINAAIPDPELSIVLDLEPEISLERKMKDISITQRDKFETIEFLKKVRANYKELAQRYGNIVIISSQGTILETQAQIRATISKYLEKKMPTLYEKIDR